MKKKHLEELLTRQALKDYNSIYDEMLLDFEKDLFVFKLFGSMAILALVFFIGMYVGGL